MNMVLKDISKLQNKQAFSIDKQNSNRYRLAIKEENHVRKDYYFNTPIYSLQTCALLDGKFRQDNTGVVLEGSNSKISIADHIVIENDQGALNVDFPISVQNVSDYKVVCDSFTLFPTMNGIAVKCAASVGQTISFTIGTHAGKKDVHSNDRFIAIMQDRFKPFVIISSVGSLGSNGNLIDSAKISYQSTGTDQYKIVLSTTNPLTKYILFEINMHEEKLFQDTTVESKQPALNNVYGSIGFIGRSHIYGEQWLYSRLDYSKLSEILDKRIDKVVLYLPQMNNNSAVISAYQVNNRFCSFGSTWDNRIPPGAFIAKSVLEKGYHKLDLTSVFVDPQKRMLHHSEGFIIQQDSPSADFSAIPTGDSCYAPQILQVTYR